MAKEKPPVVIRIQTPPGIFSDILKDNQELEVELTDRAVQAAADAVVRKVQDKVSARLHVELTDYVKGEVFGKITSRWGRPTSVTFNADIQDAIEKAAAESVAQHTKNIRTMVESLLKEEGVLQESLRKYLWSEARKALYTEREKGKEEVRVYAETILKEFDKTVARKALEIVQGKQQGE